MARKKAIYINSELNKIKGISFDTDGIPEFTTENIKLVDEYVRNKSSYSAASGDDFVRKYFSEHLEDPLELSTIITRIILIDTIDSTNLKQQLGKDYYKLMAQRILDSDIESLIKSGEKIGDKFKEIAQWSPKSNYKKPDMNLFIFVSKYITRVNSFCYGRNDYSIMDNVVKDNLPLFKRVGIDIPSMDEIRSEYRYDEFCAVVKSILNQFPGITREMLDHFIWFSFKEEAVGDK